MSGVFQLAHKRVWVAGHTGLVGSALMRRLHSEPCTLLTATRGQLDLTQQIQVHRWMAAHRPDVVFLAAAKVGGIGANATLPADFLYNNMMIAANVLRASHETGVQKLVFLGSSCIYPRDCPQPIREEYLLSGALEPTNEAYALAKIAGLKLVQYYRSQYGRDFISVMPCNLYGVNDRYDPDYAHVIPALIHKMHCAKTAGVDHVMVWGSGAPLREFMDADDLADALVFLAQQYSEAEPINIGTGAEICIRDLARITAEIIGFQGEIRFDSARPDGTPRKVLDTSRLTRLGWSPKLCLKDGINKAYQDYKGRYWDDNSTGDHASDLSRRAG